MTNEEFERVYYPKYASVIKAIARKIANRHDSLVDDLEAEGMIALWKLDPTKAKNNPDAYIRQAVKFRMVDWMRRERPALFDSLTPYLEGGAQLVQDEDTHDARLIIPHDTTRARRGREDGDCQNATGADQDDGPGWEE